MATSARVGSSASFEIAQPMIAVPNATLHFLAVNWFAAMRVITV